MASFIPRFVTRDKQDALLLSNLCTKEAAMLLRKHNESHKCRETVTGETCGYLTLANVYMVAAMDLEEAGSFQENFSDTLEQIQRL